MLKNIFGFWDSERDDAVSKIRHAAEQKYTEHSKHLDDVRKSANQKLDQLEQLKRSVIQNQIQHMVYVYKHFYRQDVNSKLDEDIDKMINECEKSYIQNPNFKNCIKFGLLDPNNLVVANCCTTIGKVVGSSIVRKIYSEDELTNAKRYADNVDKACNEMKEKESKMLELRAACEVQVAVLNTAVQRFEIVKVNDLSDRKSYEQMMLIGRCLKSIIDVDVTKNDGTSNKKALQECYEILKNLN